MFAQYAYILCALHIHYMCIMCILCLHNVKIMCTWCVHVVLFMCTLCVHYLYIMCTQLGNHSAYNGWLIYKEEDKGREKLNPGCFFFGFLISLSLLSLLGWRPYRTGCLSQSPLLLNSAGSKTLLGCKAAWLPSETSAILGQLSEGLKDIDYYKRC